jgi:hypothetical protein
VSLQELLRDTRFPNPRRHLRKIFVDPVSGRAEWGLVRAGEGGRILGVFSLSQAQPLKLAKFDARFPGFENREHVSEWKFMAAEAGAGAPTPAQTRAPQPLQPLQPLQPPSAPASPAPPAPAPAEAPAQPEPQPELPTEEPPAEPEAEEPAEEPTQSKPSPAQESGRQELI